MLTIYFVRCGLFDNTQFQYCSRQRWDRVTMALIVCLSIIIEYMTDICWITRPCSLCSIYIMFFIVYRISVDRFVGHSCLWRHFSLFSNFNPFPLKLPQTHPDVENGMCQNINFNFGSLSKMLHGVCMTCYAESDVLYQQLTLASSGY